MHVGDLLPRIEVSGGPAWHLIHLCRHPRIHRDICTQEVLLWCLACGLYCSLAVSLIFSPSLRTWLHRLAWGSPPYVTCFCKMHQNVYSPTHEKACVQRARLQSYNRPRFRASAGSERHAGSADRLGWLCRNPPRGPGSASEYQGHQGKQVELLWPSNKVNPPWQSIRGAAPARLLRAQAVERKGPLFLIYSLAKRPSCFCLLSSVASTGCGDLGVS